MEDAAVSSKFRRTGLCFLNRAVSFRLHLKEPEPALLLTLLLTLLLALALLLALTLLLLLALTLLLLLALTLLLALATALNLTRCHIILLTAILFWPGKS